MSAEQDAAQYVERMQMALADCGIDPDSVYDSLGPTGYAFDADMAEWVWRAWALACWPHLIACRAHFDEAAYSDNPKVLPPCEATRPLVRDCGVS